MTTGELIRKNMQETTFSFERVLNFRHDREVRQGKATIGNLRFASDRGLWLCDVYIDYLFRETVTMEGDDALQAFTRCLDFLSDIILGATEQRWSVWWQAEGDHGGFVE